ncbi:hypothetical protein K6V18_12520 [Ralstonia insidiosa]|uniref:hypothetical protein n=1 Tax=Ralstonia TaxID=48736 RepID=UPI000386E111|nr:MULTISPECIES: hypothetical protein [Ralstonia]EPX98996.1 membrane protein [Ralstonia sp. AU12-08]MBY4705835.1 hypothetical protein [Ralstonia insidiosa]
MFVTNLHFALPTQSRAHARGVLSRARGVRWIVTIWCLLFTVTVFSATHFPDGQAADDALEAIEAVVDDALDDVQPVAQPSKGFERAIKVALGKLVKQPGQCFSVEHWVAQAHTAPDAPSSNAAAPDHPSDAPELWLPPPPMTLAPGLRVARVRVALPPFQAGPTPAPMLRPPARA